MNNLFRKVLGGFSIVAVVAALLALAPFLAACGPTLEPQVVVETVVVEATTVVQVIETVEVEKEVKVTRVLTPAAPTDTPQAGPTESSPPTPRSPGVVVRQELERLASGRIAYNPPTEMTVDKTERVEVRISMDTAAPLTTGLKGSGTPTVESIPVSCFMKVRLVGEAFSIVAFSSEEQIVPAQGFTEWAWDVTPKQSGERTLSLIVTALVKAVDAEGTRDLPIVERQIHVKVNPGSMVSTFFRDNRGWIFPAVLVPLAAALGRWLWVRQKRRKRPGEPGADEDAAQP
jgi:hypothetical protein